MKILNASQIKELDTATLQEQGVAEIDLMERAAAQCTSFLITNYPDRERQVVVFCGPGNNGGDGLAIARQLLLHGYHDVRTFLFNTNNTLGKACAENAERLREVCAAETFTEVTTQFEAPDCTERTLVVDALFGTGLNKPLSGGYAALTQFINASGAEVVAVDIPSGLMCEDNSANTPAAIVRAAHTLTFQTPKLAFLLPDSAEYAGQVHLLDIGLSTAKTAALHTPFRLTQTEEVAALLKSRPVFGHKGTFGHALIVAGSRGMAGAAALAARACLRGGAGKVTVHTPLCNSAILQTSVPCAVLHPDPDNDVFTTPAPAAGFDSAAVGPGLGLDKRTAHAVVEQLRHASAPLVIDADALNILGAQRGWLSQLPPQSVLTPHPAEMRRLSPCGDSSYSLLHEAVATAKRHRLFVVLKGHFTAVCMPDGNVRFNPTGNPGMATAGSGDVLTGLLAALLAQGYAPADACVLGVFLHGLAGDLAADDLTEECVTAEDIIAYLPKAFKKLGQARGGR